MHLKRIIPILCVGVFCGSAAITSLLMTKYDGENDSVLSGTDEKTVVFTSGIYLNMTVEEKYAHAEMTAVCTPLEILPAKYTYEGDEGVCVSVVTTDILMQITASDDVSMNGQTFLLRVDGGEVEDRIVVCYDSPLDSLQIGEEYLMFLSPELTARVPDDAVHTEDAGTVYRIVYGGSSGVFVKDSTAEALYVADPSTDSHTWVSLEGGFSITPETLVSTEVGNTALLDCIFNP